MADVARGTTALVWGVAATLAFAALRAVVAIGGHEPLPIDHSWNELMGALTSDVWLVVAWVPAIVGGTVGMIVIGALLIVWLLWRRRRWDAATLAIAMVAVVAIGATMAAVIGRTRPEDSLAESVATSFPSGHTAVATTVVVILGLIFRRWYVWMLGTVWALMMMWSRTYLHAHWLSDVVAGMLEGVAVATVVWACVSLWRSRRAARARAEQSVQTRDDALREDPLRADPSREEPIERSAP
ncbi:phosphatase PAP2 family protein [Microbacterium sp.]|uniref:phosphatase PAP2 family protein n=1 Tax=Microbacterium sp. TaxID=51671 RepID=UPI00289DC5E7|nr:phosphatase PAP2 family protein [Microbacterium sp.]